MTDSLDFLPLEWVTNMSRLSIATKSKLRGQHKGSHRSQRFGASLDFSDFREYHPGDDVRQVDWNVFARTDKYFIKRFLDEQEMRVHILLDSTKSMSDLRKWLFARQLATALGLIVLHHDDRLSFSYVDNDRVVPFRRKGSNYRKAYVKYVSDIQKPNYDGFFTDKALASIPKDLTVLFVISDCLEPIAKWELLLRKFPRFAGDIRILQLQTAEEKSPAYSGDLRLIDLETNEQLNITMTPNILKDYEKKRAQHQQDLERLCRQYGIRFMPVQVEDGLQHVMFHQLLKANWVE